MKRFFEEFICFIILIIALIIYGILAKIENIKKKVKKWLKK